MSNKNITIIAIIILIILVIGYFAFWHNSKPVVSQNQPQKITIAEFGEVFLYAPLYVADAKGFFKDEGLDVKIIPTGGDDKTFATLLSGDAQFGVADPTFVAISGEKGQPGRVVASILSGVPFWGVVKNPKIPQITKPSDLKNYNVATFAAPSTAYTLQEKMFQSGGLKPNITQLAFGTLIPALDANKVDIALDLEPNVSTAVQNGDRIVYALSDYYPQFALTGLTALPDYINKNPETVQKVVDALQEAMTYIRTNPSDVASLMVKRFPDVKLDIAQNAIDNMIKSNVFPQDTLVSEASWNAAIELRKEVGDIKGDAPYSTYVITTFSNKAK